MIESKNEFSSQINLPIKIPYIIQHRYSLDQYQIFSELNIFKLDIVLLIVSDCNIIRHLDVSIVVVAGDVDDDTSDYDTDPYSRSDPVSVRSAKGRINHSYSRSEDGHGFRTKANSLSHDSGTIKSE